MVTATPGPAATASRRWWCAVECQRSPESQQLQQVDVGDVQSSFSKVHEVQQPLQADVSDVQSSVSEVHEVQQPLQADVGDVQSSVSEVQSPNSYSK